MLYEVITLEEASQHKSQFLASMSHELRTPLNAILGFNEMMLDGLCGEVPEGFKDPLQEMQTSGKHLLRLINNRITSYNVCYTKLLRAGRVGSSVRHAV